jgi:hypothetical protein
MWGRLFWISPIARCTLFYRRVGCMNSHSSQFFIGQMYDESSRCLNAMVSKTEIRAPWCPYAAAWLMPASPAGCQRCTMYCIQETHKFRFIQAGSEMSALTGQLPSRLGYQPTLGTEHPKPASIKPSPLPTATSLARLWQSQGKRLRPMSCSSRCMGGLPKGLMPRT